MFTSIMRFNLITLFALLACMKIAKAKFKDTQHGCEAIANFYEEISCIPKGISDANGCPVSYDCDSIESYGKNKTCLYGGEIITVGNMIPKNIIRNSCAINCYCETKGSQNGTGFGCSVIDCVDRFDEEGQKCLHTYEDFSCCATNQICDETQLSKLSNCPFEDVTYREGQIFYPQNTCLQCLCTQDFNGSADHTSKYCSKINCGIEVYYQDMLSQNCAPIFTEGSCCTFDWICKSDEHYIIENSSNISNDEKSAERCLFGNATMFIGDSIVSDDECVTCSCDIPPVAMCTKKRGC